MKKKPANATLHSPARSHSRRRWWRLLLLLCLGGAAGVFLFLAYLNKVGLPQFIKDRVIAEARAKGLEIDFARIRLSWQRGLLIEDLQVNTLNQGPRPQLFAEETRLRLDRQHLRQRQLRLDGIFIKKASLYWPLGASNTTHSIFTIRNLDADLQQTADDQWRMRYLRGRLLDIDLQLTGVLTNASRVRLFRASRTPRSADATAELYRRFLAEFAKVHYAGNPSFTGHIYADGRHLGAGHSSITFAAEAIESPWAAGTNVAVTLDLLPTTVSNTLNAELRVSAQFLRRSVLSAGPVECRIRAQPSLPDFALPDIFSTVHLGELAWPGWTARELELETHLRLVARRLTNAEVRLEVARLQGAGTRLRELSLAGDVLPSLTNSASMLSTLRLDLGMVETRLGNAQNAQLHLQATHSTNAWLPAPLRARLELQQLTNAFGTVERGAIAAELTLPTLAQLFLLDTNRVWPDRLTNLPVHATATLAGLNAQQLHLPEFRVIADWSPPFLALQGTNQIDGGELGFQAGADTTTREVQFSARSTFDAYLVKPWLTTNTQRWLSKYTWTAPPLVEATGRVLLPAWTNRHPDWRQEVLPTLSLGGRFASGDAAYRQVPFSSARSEFFFTNLIWRLPELVITRPEGTAVADYTSNQRTRDYHWSVHSELDPRIARPLLEKESQRKGFDSFVFTCPPIVDAQIWGRWKEPDLVGVRAKVALTNFSFRGETAEAAWGQIQYTNHFLEFLAPEVRRPNERGSANGVAVDLVAKLVTLTNAFGNLNPRAVARTISPKALKVIEPYHFDVNPTIRANGLIDYNKNGHKTDAHLEVSGGLFHWRVFNLQEIRGNIDWQGQFVQVTNLAGQGYGGRLSGDVSLNFARTNGGEFSFNTTVAALDLRSLMQDLTTHSNALEGGLGGELHVRHGLLADTNSWQGAGHVQLTDGLIWDLPVFGVFSPILNMLIPGLGNSRAREAAATFIITNSVIETSDLEIASTAMRMRYQGSVTFDARVNGRMEAELLRNIPGLGYFISKLFWPVTKVFEYRITGTLGQPKTEPLHVLPRLILMPLQPLKTLKDIFLPAPDPTPAKKPLP